jgi:cell division transport system permease protein
MQCFITPPTPPPLNQYTTPPPTFAILHTYMNSQIFFLVGESIRAWRKHRLVILPSLVILFLCSVLLAIALTFLHSVVVVSGQDAELYAVEIFLEDGLRKLPVSTEKALENYKSVQHWELITPEEALVEFSERFGQDMLQLIDENPLPASLRLQMQPGYRNMYELKKLQGFVAPLPGVQQVQTNLELIDWIEGLRFDFVFWPVLIVLILAATLWMIISNAVRLTLLSRRNLVENMKYGGASDFFIQFPFVLEGAVQGFVGSVTAAVFCGILFHYISQKLPVFYGVLQPPVLWFVALVVGVTLLGAVSSYKTVRTFLIRNA